MSKRIIKLAPNVSSWCDAKNHIYLTMPNKTSRKIPDDIDMTNIEKGIKAKLIVLLDVNEPVVEKKPVKVVEPIAVSEPEVTVHVIEQPKPKRNTRKKKEVVEEVVEQKNDKEE